ncbi:MAG: PQQ-dependent sugar dehydrogenase, partial [Chloroflexi bacterium]|nr:PQQ-dependent sugar dehydrogenase [Chloroflexota bacterium]
MAFTDAEGARALVIDQVGLVRVLNVAEGLLPEPFLDLRDRMVAVRSGYDERGLLGIALHPGFAENGRLFVYYSAPLAEGGPGGWDHTSHVSEFAVSPDSPDRADPASERVILQVHQPQANHNGGALAFGPDGYLYISL